MSPFMQHIGFLDATPVYVCDAVIVPSDRGGGIEQELAIRVRKTAKDGAKPAIVLTPAQYEAAKREHAEAEAQHAAAAKRAEAKGTAPPEPLKIALELADIKEPVDEPEPVVEPASELDDDEELAALEAAIAAMDDEPAMMSEFPDA